MKVYPRSYAGLQDFQHLDAVLSAGYLAGKHSHYIHPGDLRWWLFYTFPEEDHWSNLYLWEDEFDQVVAWTLLTPKDKFVDLFYRPELNDTAEMRHMLRWSVDRISEILRRQGETQLKKDWVRDEDAPLRQALEALGFNHPESNGVHMVCALDCPLPDPCVPHGFKLRGMRGLEDLEMRAAVQYSAFESDIPMDRYLARFERYLRSPAYAPEQDVVVEAPDGQLVAFARLWLDPITGWGNFEPVGVHKDYWRRGLGRAVMLEGLRRLKSWGMQHAQVGTGVKNEPAIRLYEAVGFRTAWHPMVYTKDLNIAQGS